MTRAWYVDHPGDSLKTILDSLTRQLSTSRYSWAEVLCRLHRPKHPSNWTRAVSQVEMDGILALLSHAAASGALDEYHVEGGTEGVPQVLLGHEAHPFELGTCVTFGPNNPALFCLVGVRVG